MRYAVIGDIHACLEGLDIVIRDCKSQGVDKIIGLGDYVDLGPDPKDCVDLANYFFDVALQGNHDRGFLKGYIGRVDEDTRISREWTKKNWFDPDVFRKVREELNTAGGSLLEKINELYRKNPPRNKEKVQHFMNLLNLVMQEEYFDFLESLNPYHQLDDNGVKMIFAHGFPLCLAFKEDGSINEELMERLGVYKKGEATEKDFEVYREFFSDLYVITKGEWKRRKEEKREKYLKEDEEIKKLSKKYQEEGKTDKEVKELLEKYIKELLEKYRKGHYVIAQELAKELEDDTVLFVAHMHIPFKYRIGRKRVVNVGAVFDARHLGNNTACWALCDTRYDIEDDRFAEIRRVRYDRGETERKTNKKGVLGA